MTLNYIAPNINEIEFTLFGPGYGESAVVHIGNNQWIVIDSCRNNSNGTVAALSYFSRLGVNPAEAVKLIIATHWHDDHIKGMAELLTVCDTAKFCCSQALNSREFQEYIAAYNLNNRLTSSTGVQEIQETFFVAMQSRRKSIKLANEGKLLLKVAGANLAHGCDCEIHSLSPSDEQVQKAFYQ